MPYLGDYFVTDSIHENRVHARRPKFASSFLPAGAWIVTLLMLAEIASAAQRAASPDFQQAAKIIAAQFAATPGYVRGDLITQQQIKDALDKLSQKGWNIRDKDAIVDLGLAENSFLARELSTPAGKKFMRKIAHIAGAYERLDRLSANPRGQSTVRNLIRQKGGDELVEYLATTKGGRNMGNMLAGARQVTNLNERTGRIYTADDLLAALERSYEQPTK
jgi:hypothetical protein